ncbi:hypothetical protein ACFPN2_12210 [Steroidobacter flavus]|uniref:Uncharacterized protein n=1 Tax=Steroidobacter flavus TaxID=1842136 RepID=A0ABV8SR26_9GAMM
MTLNTLFLPLLGGFLFYGLFNGTSHRAPVESPQVALFWSAAIGLGLLLTGRISVYLFQEVFRDYQAVQLKLFAAATCPLVGALALGFMILFATHTIHSSVIDAHKLKAVLGIVAAVLAGYFFLQLDPLLSTLSSRVLGLDLRLYGMAAVVALAWAAQRFAKFGAIPWGTALIRISASALFVATLLHFFLEYQGEVVGFWHAVTKPVSQSAAASGLGSAFVACLLGIGLALLINCVYTRDVAETRYALGKGPSQLERLFYAATIRKSLVVLSTHDRKVYVGTVKAVAIRGNKDPYVVIYPTMSGYRTEDKLCVELTNFYPEVYLLPEDGQAKSQWAESRWAEFQRVLPLDRIASASFYQRPRLMVSPLPNP